ncbi:MAG: TlyA family RNA methyltransferase [Hyphomicrobiaceae bacterium]|nr:TlyA family RNA methyltransferase [Hyphomicrobiaceae bacterium]
MSERRRLDEALVERALAPSRARARDAVQRGHVTVDGAVETKPARKVGPEQILALSDPAAGYVARSALKLVAALDAFAITVDGRLALDVGASTGGFTQVMLERGAKRVVAIDVGHDQLHPAIGADPRVEAHEGLNARDLDADALGGPFDLVSVDLSFISVLKVLEPILSCLAAEGDLVILAKPQFEVGRDGLGKGGIVRDPGEAEAAVRRIEDAVAERGLVLTGRIASPIEGGDGNREFLIAARRC